MIQANGYKLVDNNIPYKKVKGGKKVEHIYKETKTLTSEVIGEIYAIEKEIGLTAENLLKQAKNKTSSLHDFFDWDNKTAGKQWRIQQARVLINEIKIIVDEKMYYAYENVRITSASGVASRVYKPKFEIISNEKLRLQLVKRALENIKYWQDQNSIYSELQPIFLSIERTRKKLETKWQKNKQ